MSAATVDQDRAAPRRDRMPCLDGLRGLAALMVVFSHAPEPGLGSLVSPLAGANGVLIFFGLSGFLMGDLYLARTPTADAMEGYMAARIARIAPIYYSVVIASFLLCTFVMPAFVYHFPPAQFARLLTFNGSASVFWSISPEVQFYFLFIPLWLLHNRLGNDAVFALVLAALAGLCIATIAWWPGIVVFSKFHIFACGVLAAMARRALAPRLNGASVLALHGASIALLITLIAPGAADAILRDPHAGHPNDPAFAAFYGDPARCLLAGFLAFSLSFESRIGRVVFANSLALLLGRCSFSIYLLHVVVFSAVAQSGIAAEMPPMLAGAVAVALTILVSAATYSVVEAPARNHVRRLLLALMNVPRPALRLRRRPV